ncbi:MAG: peptidoglycan D,D-transpeptidase FtsI family protein [Phycisphaerales bacterium JB039]
MALAIGVSVLLAVIMVRVIQLQVAPGTPLAQLVSSRTSARPIPTLRGDLVDRRGRPLATTRFGYRLFIDPVALESEDLDARITRLADALGVEPLQIGESIVTAVAANQARRAAAGSEGAPEPPPLIRHVRLVQRMTDLQVRNVRRLGLPGVHLERLQVREYPGGELVAPIVGKVGFEEQGLLGVEALLDQSLRGEHGRVQYARDARGRPLWMGDGAVVPARRGVDTRLSIDLELQRIAHEELLRGIEDAGAAGGRLLAMDPVTGEILAMLDIIRELPDIVEYRWRTRGEPWKPDPPGYAPRYRVIEPDPRRGLDPAWTRNRCIQDMYEPGSTFKPIIWSLVTEAVPGILGETFDGHSGLWRTEYGRTIRDVHKAEKFTWPEALEWSSNIAMAQGAARLTPAQLRGGITSFGFGSQAGSGLPAEMPGIVTSAEAWSKWTHTSVSFGNEISVTALQLARAYCAFARPGELAGTMPEVRLVVPGADGPAAYIRTRVLAPAVALRTRQALRIVAERMDAQMRLRWPEEPRPRYTMFGKSGTADVPTGAPPDGKRRPPGAGGYLDEQYISSFVAGAPFEQPRIVIVVTIDDPGPQAIRARRHYGSQCAGPVVRRFVERALAYLGEPASPELQSNLLASGN